MRTQLFVHYVLSKEQKHTLFGARKALVREIESSFKVKLASPIIVICYYTNQLEFVKFLEDYNLNIFISKKSNFVENQWQIYGQAIPRGIPIRSILCDSLNTSLGDPLRQGHVEFSQLSETLFGFTVKEKIVGEVDTIEIHTVSKADEDIFLDGRILQDFSVKDKKVICKGEIGTISGKKSVQCLIPWLKGLRTWFSLKHGYTELKAWED